MSLDLTPPVESLGGTLYPGHSIVMAMPAATEWPATTRLTLAGVPAMPTASIDEVEGKWVASWTMTAAEVTAATDGLSSIAVEVTIAETVIGTGYLRVQRGAVGSGTQWLTSRVVYLPGLGGAGGGASTLEVEVNSSPLVFDPTSLAPGEWTIIFTQVGGGQPITLAPTGYMASGAAWAPGINAGDESVAVFRYSTAASSWVCEGCWASLVAAVVTPQEPTFVDQPGTASDSYTIPTTTGVEYRKGGVAIAAGTYAPTAGETVTITAVAVGGYSLTGTTSWTFTFGTAAANTAPSMTLGAASATNLDVSQSFTTSDVDGDTVTVTADWGDGGGAATVTSPATHHYASAGTYTATFTPNDGTANGAVRTAIFTVSPSAIPPVGNPATLQQAMLDYGAAGYWKFNETSGTTVTDYSGNNRHGTLSGAAGTDYTLAGQDGRLKILTATGKVLLPDADGFSIGANGLTIFCVNRLTSNGSGRNLVRKGDDGVTTNDNEWKVTVNFLNLQAASVAATGSTNLAYSATSDNPNTQAVWHGIGTAIPQPGDGTYPVIYVDNNTSRTVSNAGGTGSWAAKASQVVVGAGMIGAIGHLAIFPTALTAAHIGKLMTLARSEGLIP